MHAAVQDRDSLDRRAACYQRIGERSMTPLWEGLGALVPPQPRSPAQPAFRRHAEVRDQVREAGRLITARRQP